MVKWYIGNILLTDTSKIYISMGNTDNNIKPLQSGGFVRKYYSLILQD